MAKRFRKSIHWFRRDLRVRDNQGLMAACEASEEVIPLYLLSDWSGDHSWTGPKRQNFLCQCLASLSKNISHLGGQLIIRQGRALQELETLITESGSEALFLNRDLDHFGRETENALKELCQRLGVAYHDYKDMVLHEPHEVLKGDGTSYRVYTPYSRPWLALEKPKSTGTPKKIQTPPEIATLPLPTLKTWDLEFDGEDVLTGGERAARDRMESALSGRLESYDDQRDIPSLLGTSRLSQDLRFGTISVRELYHKAKERASPQYLKELAWREFYFQILSHFPEVLTHEFKSDWRGLPWYEPDEKFTAWKTGQTGFPIIDAGIRELLATGFMHNRVRMIVAMFLTKDLHLDWRLGEQFFLQHLIDGEIASNNGGWQWSAGTGADAAPYFRIQNPWSQTKRYDPEGLYIRKWVPELAKAPARALYTAPEAGQSVAPGYPHPIVDHATERQVTLNIFKKHRAEQS